MIVAVQGCSHGSLSAIYDSISQYTSVHSKQVDLLLLCGDFQALRSAHDFASLAVPPKYHALGTFHEYYSGKRVAPVLTIVIGGNHEASNYMWELYHGGWLAPNIYYMGAAGSVRVGGWRIVGASGIYKDHDYTKGHFETVPYNNSTMRSIYHIRQYDVAKLMQSQARHSPNVLMWRDLYFLDANDDPTVCLGAILTPEPQTIFLSHDWPTTIPHHGDTASLLRRKPFFASEVQSDTLGSPPLLQLLKHNQPEYWFSAHLHVKFAAVYDHSGGQSRNGPSAPVNETARDVDNGIGEAAAASINPDEIQMDDFDDDEEPHQSVAPAPNPDEINIDDDDFDDPIPPRNEIPAKEAQKDLAVDESADLVEAARQADPAAAQGIIGNAGGASEGSVKADRSVEPSSMEAGPSRPNRTTKFLALDKCGPGKDFIQFLDIPSSSSSIPGDPLELTYDPEWLAITRVFHPYLSLDIRQKPLPLPDHLASLVAEEKKRIENEGLAIPPQAPNSNGELRGAEEQGQMEDQAEGKVKGRGPVKIQDVQRFWKTAPAHGEAGGSPSAWYTNPQTEAFCAMLGIPNKINPAPTEPTAQSHSAQSH